MHNIPNKKYLYITGGIVILFIFVGSVYLINNWNKPLGLRIDGQNQDGMEFLEGDPNASITDGGLSAVNNRPIKKLSYGDAIKAYPYRFQFVNCSANPGTMSVKINSFVMLDNRDKTTHTIKANGQTFRIGPLDYQILRPKIEGESFITCDGGGSGKLNVEK